MLHDALELARKGIRVMPVHGTAFYKDKIGCTCGKIDCKSPGKHPIFNLWHNIVEYDVHTITSWYRKYPHANLGIITGSKSKVVVLDIDPKNGGNQSLLEIEDKFGDIPETPMVRTGSGGVHFYFKHPGHLVGNRASFMGPGIDFRGDGGFVVAPESRHVSGDRYHWEVGPEDMPFADMPPWLMRELEKKQTSTATSVTNGGLFKEGGRNNFLTSLAGSVRQRGCGYEPIMACIWYANKQMCNPPLSADEVRAIAKSVARYEVRE
jgi:putative DNA primase/helicase